MMKILIFIIYSSFCWRNFSCSLSNDKENISFNFSSVYKYNTPYPVYVNKNIEFIMEFAGDLRNYDTPARVTVASDSANRTYPVFITARQQKGLFSWQLPMLVATPNEMEQFTNMSRTLCPHNNLFSENEDVCEIITQNTPIIQISTSSPVHIKVIIMVETVEDFYIKLNSETNFTMGPSQPKYYFFPFKQSSHQSANILMQNVKRKHMCDGDRDMPPANNYGWSIQPKSVILMIESDDDVCAVVSIQNFKCPVFDNERDILYDGYYLTMTRRGGITLNQDIFPIGFYIVFIVKSSDKDCVDQDVVNMNLSSVYVPWSGIEHSQWSYSQATTDGRVKNFRFKIIETISYREYLIGGGVMLMFFLSFYVAFLMAVLWQRRKAMQISMSASLWEGTMTSPIIQDATSIRRRRVLNSRDGIISDPLTKESDSESNVSTVDELGLGEARLCVAHLARCRPRVLSARSNMYLWNVLTVAVFYTLPVIQLVVTYQRLLNQSGNQDLCYFNFLCAHPLIMLSDFNHVYSNLGYVLLGILFLAQVWRRHTLHKEKSSADKALGIPQHFGLFYAMGIALISEGFLSAAYHVCPNSMNFQFDTSFMYVTSVLCMVKIYQSRHPDINARAHATFGVLALIIFIGLVGVLNANVVFWIVFTALHLTTCLVMTFQMYYLGRFRFDGSVVYRAARELVTRPLAAVTPTHCGRCVLLLIANLANWAIAAYGMNQHSKDFGSHLLLVLMSNLFLYTLFYIVMKILHREAILWYSWVFILFTYTIWFSSSYFYLDQSTNWAMSPAESRRNNRICSLLQLYDSHDIWHFMSATAMFFSFNMYLTIDDNLAKVQRVDIAVF